MTVLREDNQKTEKEYSGPISNIEIYLVIQAVKIYGKTT